MTEQGFGSGQNLQDPLEQLNFKIPVSLHAALREKAGRKVSAYLRALISADIEGKKEAPTIEGELETPKTDDADEGKSTGEMAAGPTSTGADNQVVLKLASQWLEVVKRVARYRHLQGSSNSDKLSDYINLLISMDIAEVRKEIEQRRRV